MSHHGELEVTLNESSRLVLPAQCRVIGDDLRWQGKETELEQVVEKKSLSSLRDGII